MKSLKREKKHSLDIQEELKKNPEVIEAIEAMKRMQRVSLIKEAEHKVEKTKYYRPLENI